MHVLPTRRLMRAGCYVKQLFTIVELHHSPPLGMRMIRLPCALYGAVTFVILNQLAFAADLGTNVPTPVTIAANWTGPYVGGSVAERWAGMTWTTTGIGDFAGPADATTTPASFNDSALRIGGFIGYNWQITPIWVVGLEADAVSGHSSKSLAGIPGTFGAGGQGAGLTAINFDSSNVRTQLGWQCSGTRRRSRHANVACLRNGRRCLAASRHQRGV